ncbi:hypothetical protein C7426_1293 [Pantoea ananatis]|nr:hypothetical protein C7426_1293 [Pantoea ananatis]
MSIRTDHEKEFISLFNSIARGTRRIQVFTDFISCSVIAIQNGLQFCEKREQKYMAIVGKRYIQTVLMLMQT